MDRPTDDDTVANTPADQGAKVPRKAGGELDIPYLAEFHIGGYEWLESLDGSEWHAVPSWGRDGWDLGSWPLVCVAHFNGGERGYAVARYVEGDVIVEAFATRQERDARTDEIALFFWRQFGDGPDCLPECAKDLRPEDRGPYSRTRADRERQGELPGRVDHDPQLPGIGLT